MVAKLSIFVGSISSFLSTVFLTIGAATAADGQLLLQSPSQIMKDIAAIPLIADPANVAQRNINAAVKRLNDPIRKAVASCKSEGGDNWDWSRSVDVTMRGPKFLSYTITDNAFCGGAHPSSATMSIVYNLQTGQPIDWTRFLPPSLTGTLALSEGMDGTKMVTLASPKLYALYLAKYRPRTGNKKQDADDEECRKAVSTSGDEPPAMMAWLDAKENGLAIQFDLPHAVQACADTIVIPVGVLRSSGAQPALVEAIEAAHRLSNDR